MDIVGAKAAAQPARARTVVARASILQLNAANVAPFCTFVFHVIDVNYFDLRRKTDLRENKNFLFHFF